VRTSSGEKERAFFGSIPEPAFRHRYLEPCTFARGTCFGNAYTSDRKDLAGKVQAEAGVFVNSLVKYDFFTPVWDPGPTEHNDDKGGCCANPSGKTAHIQSDRSHADAGDNEHKDEQVQNERENLLPVLPATRQAVLKKQRSAHSYQSTGLKQKNPLWGTLLGKGAEENGPEGI
jgi:hypothetical protein